jgi:glycosyltransferase involved in cell wall biosynthesis
MDSAALAEAAVALLSDEAARRRCGAALRRRVETAFTEEASAARYAALYRELAA